MSSVDTTAPVLKPVDTHPAIDAVETDPKLKPLRTITLDEDPPAPPSATLLLDPVQEVRVPREIGGSGAVTLPKKRKAPLQADAFESAPRLEPARPELVSRGSPWKKTAVWTPGLIALTAALVFVVLATIVTLLRAI